MSKRSDGVFMDSLTGERGMKPLSSSPRPTAGEIEPFVRARGAA